MTTFQTEIHINRPPADVFALLVDLPRQTEWMQAIQEVTVEGDGPTQLDTRYHAVHVDHGTRVELENTITAYEPSATLGIKHVMPGTDMHSTYTLKEADGGTHLSVSMSEQPNDVGPRPSALMRLFVGLIRPLVNAQVRKQMNEDMASFKALAETQNSP